MSVLGISRCIPALVFAYHGSTGLSQAASGFRSLNEGIYDLDDPDFVKVPFPAAHLFTYSGHVPSVSAASKVIEIITENNLIENGRKTGARLLKGLKEVERYPDVVVEVAEDL